MKYKLSGLVLLLVVVMQFVPYGRDHVNPPTAGEPQWDSPRTRELFFTACVDCHSNETSWPWYSSVAPVSWLVAHDVVEGREHFNVSMWGVQQHNAGDDAAEEVRDGEMPPGIYLIAHPRAKLSEAEARELADGLAATFRGDGHE
jgi:mono/diheme cytochrome c family protein